MEEKLSHRLASYGRRIGRRLTSPQQELIDEFLPHIQLKASENSSAAPSIELSSVFSREAPVWLEIGFGGGEHLFQLAKQHPEINFIGAEPYYNGVVSLLRQMQDASDIQNIRVVADDIRPVIEQLPDSSLERVYLLFPDPWPKTKHHKRRIVTQGFLEEIERILKIGGRLKLATDHYDYSVWMLEQLAQRSRLDWNANRCGDWHTPPEEWVSTRYEQKTRAEGRQPVYLDFTKVA